MTWDELCEQGRRVARDSKDLDQQMQGLVADPRFAALLGWLEARRGQYVEEGSSQRMASHHGPLAHCQGSVFAYGEILGELRRVFEAGRRK